MNERTTIFYQHVLRGLSEEWSQMEALDHTFETLLADARRIERGQALRTMPPDWESDWARIESLLGEIRTHAAGARARLRASVEPDSDPLAEWQPVAAIEDEVEELLAVRKEAGGRLVAPEDRFEWESCWLALESYFSTLRAHAKSVQVTLELQRRFGEAKAAEMTAELLSKLPADLQDQKGTEAFQAAVTQLQSERHQFRGLWDIMKALALYVETPEERARKIRGAG